MKWLNNINPFYWKRKALCLQDHLDNVAGVRLKQEEKIIALTTKWHKAVEQVHNLECELEKAKALNNKWFTTVVGLEPFSGILMNQALRGKELMLYPIIAKWDEVADEEFDDNNA